VDWCHWTACLITLAGLALRLYGIDSHSLWFDEANEYHRVMASWPVLLLGRPVDMDPPLYYLLLRPWLVIGHDEWALRSLSALLGAWAINGVYHWARKVTAPATALIAALLFAFAPATVYYSQELNQYGLVMLLAVLLLLSVERLLAKESRGNWLMLAALSAAALSTHYSFIWLLGAVNSDLLIIWTKARQWNKLKSWGLYAGWILGLGGMLLVGTSMPAKIQRAHANWQVQAIPETQSTRVPSLIIELKRGFFDFFTLPAARDQAEILIAGFAVLFFVGMVRLWHRGPTGRRILFLLFVPLCLAYAANTFGLYPSGERHILFLAPVFYIITATGLEFFRDQATVFTPIVAVIGIAFAGFIPNSPFVVRDWAPREDSGPVVAYVETNRTPGELIYVYYGAVPAFNYYYHGLSQDVVRSGWIRNWPLEAKVGHFLTSVEDHPRVWYVFSHVHPGDEAVVDSLQSDHDFEIANEFQTAGAGTYLLERTHVEGRQR